jgi:hypothetical protein
VCVRLHINLPDELVGELDRRVGPRRRSSFIARAVEHALVDDRRWELIDSALGSISDEGHGWDSDPASWVRDQRRTDEGRVG